MTRSVAVYDSLGQAYERAFATFLAHTDQKEKAREWLDRAVSGLPQRHVLIDAGAGNGRVTAWYTSAFGRTIAIEPNPHLRVQLEQACPAAEVLGTPILQSQPGERGDLVLVSHVFYYIPDAEWDETLARLASFLAEDGLLVVILQNGGTDCMQMLEHFHGRRFDLPGLAARFIAADSQQFTTQVETVDCHVTTSEFGPAYEIGEFMLNLLPMDEPPPREEFEEYIRARWATPDGGFRFSCSQDFLTIRRRLPA